MVFRQLVIAVAILFAIPSLASATPKHRPKDRPTAQAEIVCDRQGCRSNTEVNSGPASGFRHAPAVSYSGRVVAHPEGCPWRQFCGCGASIRVFGRSIRSLWLAAAWFKFPRATPAPGMAAVRNHHVMVLESHVSGDVWTVYDANSGGHQTRVHQRSIAGYVIVNPRASQVAGL